MARTLQREELVSVIDELLADGGRTIVLVDGYSGAGKTSLARELVATRGVVAVNGTSYQSEGVIDVRRVRKEIVKPFRRGRPLKGAILGGDEHKGRGANVLLIVGRGISDLSEPLEASQIWWCESNATARAQRLGGTGNVPGATFREIHQRLQRTESTELRDRMIDEADVIVLTDTDTDAEEVGAAPDAEGADVDVDPASQESGSHGPESDGSGSHEADAHEVGSNGTGGDAEVLAASDESAPSNGAPGTSNAVSAQAVPEPVLVNDAPPPTGPALTGDVLDPAAAVDAGSSPMTGDTGAAALVDDALLPAAVLINDAPPPTGPPLVDDVPPPTGPLTTEETTTVTDDDDQLQGPLTAAAQARRGAEPPSSRSAAGTVDDPVVAESDGHSSSLWTAGADAASAKAAVPGAAPVGPDDPNGARPVGPPRARWQPRVSKRSSRKAPGRPVPGSVPFGRSVPDEDEATTYPGTPGTDSAAPEAPTATPDPAQRVPGAGALSDAAPTTPQRPAADPNFFSPDVGDDPSTEADEHLGTPAVAEPTVTSDLVEEERGAPTDAEDDDHAEAPDSTSRRLRIPGLSNRRRGQQDLDVPAVGSLAALGEPDRVDAPDDEDTMSGDGAPAAGAPPIEASAAGTEAIGIEPAGTQSTETEVIDNRSTRRGSTRSASIAAGPTDSAEPTDSADPTDSAEPELPVEGDAADAEPDESLEPSPVAEPAAADPALETAESNGTDDATGDSEAASGDLLATLASLRNRADALEPEPAPVSGDESSGGGAFTRHTSDASSAAALDVTEPVVTTLPPGLTVVPDPAPVSDDSGPAPDRAADDLLPPPLGEDGPSESAEPLPSVDDLLPPVPVLDPVAEAAPVSGDDVVGSRDRNRAATRGPDASERLRMKLQSLVEILGSEMMVADFLEVEPTELRSWLLGRTRPRRASSALVTDLAYFWDRLITSHEEASARSWLMSPNSTLGDAAPIDYLRRYGPLQVMVALDVEEPRRTPDL